MLSARDASVVVIGELQQLQNVLVPIRMDLLESGSSSFGSDSDGAEKYINQLSNWPKGTETH